MTNSNLEQKAEKIDWKQWLPVYGIYQARKDLETDKPNIFQISSDAKYLGGLFYHGFSGAGIVGGLYKLTERLF